MTVSSETNRVSYNGDDSTVVFTVPFYFLLDTSIKVTHVASDDTETTWVLNTDYTVTDAGVESGGSITATTAPATGERLVIIRSESLTQTTDYIENDDFPAASHERALDKAMMINQQQQEEIARCVTAPVGDDGTTDYTLPTYSASNYLQWHPTLAELRNAALTDLGTATVGTDAGDLVELVTVGAGVGFPALYLDNLTLSGTALGDVITKDHGTAAGEIPLNSDLGTAAVKNTGTAAGEVPLNSDLGTASTKDHGTAAGEIPLNSDLSYTDITLATAQAPTSSTTINFTNIPSGTKKITVMFQEVSTNGESDLIIQIGDSGGLEITGYKGSDTNDTGAIRTQYDTGFMFCNNPTAGGAVSGVVTLDLIQASTFAWVETHNIGKTTGEGSFFGAGSKSLSAELDRLTITTVGGTNVFDAGLINISYE